MYSLSYETFMANKTEKTLNELEYDPQRYEHPSGKDVDLQVPVYSGFYKEQTEIQGKQRKFIVYIPTHHKASGPGVMLMAPDYMSAEKFLVDSGWVELAEEQQFIILAGEACNAQTWDVMNAEQTEIPFVEALYGYATARNLFSINESSYYAAGYDAGADIIQLYAAKNATLLAGIAAVGGNGLSVERLSVLGSRQVVGNVNGEICEDPYRKVNEIPLPVQIYDKECCNLEACVYWNQVNKTTIRTDNGDTTQYSYDISRYGSFINQQPVQKVLYTKLENSDGGNSWLCRKIWDFLSKVKRHAGNTLAGTLRPSKTWQDIGLIRYSEIIDGREREWLLYVPSIHRRHPEKKLPLVVGLHGYSCSGEIFMNDSEWYKVAEERGFFVMFPSACVNGSLSTSIPSMEMNVPLPTWNSFIPQDPNGPDDLLFFRKAIDRIESDYPVDRERKYLCGHSNGSMQTQCMMLQWPGEFAAYAPHGAAMNEFDPDQLPPYASDIETPMWLFKGTYDIGCKADFSGSSANRKTVEYVAAHNGLDTGQEPKVLVNGDMIHYTYVDADNHPNVIFTELIDYPHAYTPEVAWATWDQFFVHFKRKEDGSIEYLQ